MVQFSSATKGEFLKTTDGTSGGSAAPVVNAVNADLILAVLDTQGGTASGGPASQDGAIVISPTVEVAAAVAVAYDFNWICFGRDTLPAAFTYADWRNGASVIVPVTRCTRASTGLGAPQVEALHLFRYVVWAISANAAGTAPAVAVTCKARCSTL